ncbi:MAG: thioredoxin domain-containing protein, partial [Elusimicrobiota bacterium]
ICAAAETALKSSYDLERGGFGEAPKFPMPANLRFLLRRHARTASLEAKTMALDTLRAMARGGIFDQLGGGFARYSTDAAWRTPHFEKTLYDNAQLLENLADAWQVAPEPWALRALQETAAYLARDLKSSQGGFYCAQDADSHADDQAQGHKSEGAYYLWKKKEVEERLGPDGGDFCRRYGVVDEGNALSDPQGEFAGKCVLYEADPAAMDEPRAGAARAILLAARSKRTPPDLDDKILTSWNGLVVAGLARAYGATGDKRLLDLADGAADFIRRELCDGDGKRLWRCWREGTRGVAGMADDYVFLIHGLLELFEAGFKPDRLAWAVSLAEEALRLFSSSEGGLYQVASGEGAELFARAMEDHDGAEPAPSSVFVEACLRLYELTGREHYRVFARRTLDRFAAQLSARPLSMPYLLSCLERAGGKSTTLLLAGCDLPGADELLRAARSGLRPDVIVSGYRLADKDSLADLMPALRDIPTLPRARAYLCIDRVCGLPIEDAAELSRRLDAR